MFLSFLGKYWIQLFMNRHMGNCQVYHFSCAGLPDGYNEHPVKRPGPYYVICLQERVVLDGTCPRDTEWHAQTFPTTVHARSNVPSRTLIMV